MDEHTTRHVKTQPYLSGLREALGSKQCPYANTLTTISTCVATQTCVCENAHLLKLMEPFEPQEVQDAQDAQAARTRSVNPDNTPSSQPERKATSWLVQ